MRRGQALVPRAAEKRVGRRSADRCLGARRLQLSTAVPAGRAFVLPAAWPQRCPPAPAADTRRTTCCKAIVGAGGGADGAAVRRKRGAHERLRSSRGSSNRSNMSNGKPQTQGPGRLQPAPACPVPLRRSLAHLSAVAASSIESCVCSWMDGCRGQWVGGWVSVSGSTGGT